MNPTTVFELLAVAFLLAVLVLVVRHARATGARWDEAIAEHIRVTGRYPTVAKWRAGRIGEAARPKPALPVTVTVTAVDGQPVAGGAR